MAFQQGLSVVASPASIQTSRGCMHYTPMGRDGKPTRGIWGREGGGQCTARWEPHRQAIWRDEEAPFPIPPLRPSMSSCIPFTLHRALLQNLGSRATRQLLHPFARSLFLPVLTASPGSVYPFTSSHGELKQGWLLSGRKYMGDGFEFGGYIL